MKVSGCDGLTPGTKGVGTLASCNGDESASLRGDMLVRIIDILIIIISEFI